MKWLKMPHASIILLYLMPKMAYGAEGEGLEEKITHFCEMRG